MYVTAQYYYEVYGGEMPENDLVPNIRKAEAYIRSLTYIRGDIFSSDLDLVRDAVCAAAEVYYQYHKDQQRRSESGTAGPIKSENNDGYSVTYVVEQTDGQTAEEVLKRKLYEAVYQYLLPTGWLSRRVRCCYDYEHGYHNL